MKYKEAFAEVAEEMCGRRSGEERKSRNQEWWIEGVTFKMRLTKREKCGSIQERL